MQCQQPSAGLPHKPFKRILFSVVLALIAIIMEIVDPVAREFIGFCIQRNGKEWPALYDEMCWVAGRRLFRGLGYAELRRLGLSLSLTSIDGTIRMVDTVVAEK